MSALYMAAMATLMWANAGAIASVFLGSADSAAAAVLPLAASLIAIAAAFCIVDGAQVAAMGALRGINDTMVPFLLGLLGYWVIGMSSGYLFGFVWGFGAIGIWWGLALGLAASATMLSWRFTAAPRRSGTAGEREEGAGKVAPRCRPGRARPGR
jgi:MATE family multidrug resistance protein